MPYYREQLLSAWPSHMVFEVGAPPVKLDAQFLGSLNVMDGVHFTLNPRTTRRNQITNTRLVDKRPTSIQAPKFLSERARESANSANTLSMDRRISDVAESLSSAELSSLKAEVPAMYRVVEIKYSKFGVDDFDFGYVMVVICCAVLWLTDKDFTTRRTIPGLKFTYLIPTQIRCSRFYGSSP